MSGIYSELLNFPQANGDQIRLRVFGSSHYSRYENVDGYTVIYDKQLGLFCYADLRDSKLLSTGVTIDLPPPPVARHLEESSSQVVTSIEQRMSRHGAELVSFHEVNRTFGPSQGLLNGRQLSIDTVRGLTILVNFSDVTSSTTAADV
jgi:hypothetical protein